jgi:hypothetical protein
MNTTAIVGWSGFVGQYLTQFFPESDLYNSENIESLRGRTYATIYFSAMPAEKWRINQFPAEDERLVSYFKDILRGVSCEEFVLISTVDVLECTISQSETGTLWASHPYGRHRRDLEEFVITHFPNHIILRLPGLFGTGLKKNILYDLLHENQLENICLDSTFQWYNLNNLQTDVEFCRENKIPLIHLVSIPIETRTIVERFFPDAIQSCKGLRAVKYCLSSDYPLNRHVLEEIGAFVEHTLRLKSLLPRIAISNIAWGADNRRDAEKILSRYGIRRIELAFTKICEWGQWNDEVISTLQQLPYEYPSCQSILYKTDIHIFRDTQPFLDHISHVLSLCTILHISRIVFGSPRARHIYATSLPERIRLFKQLGDLCHTHGIILCVEPNARTYGCTWLTNLAETVEFVLAVNHPNVRINFDFGNYLMEEDTTPLTVDIVRLIAHVQISAPFLSVIRRSLSSTYISLWNKLRTAGYDGSISLEATHSDSAEFLTSCVTLVDIISSP